MSKVIQFPSDSTPKPGLQRVKSTYTVREISEQFGLSETYIRRWTREGFIEAARAETGELRYDFRALKQFRRVRELRSQGLSPKQIDAELRGQLNLFRGPEGRLLRLPIRLSPFEEALLLHERNDKRAPEAYQKAIESGDCVADAWCNLGIWAFEAGRPLDAFDRLTQGLSRDPRHFESHFNLATLYFESRDFHLARLHYEIASGIEPNFPELYFNLGLVHAVDGDLIAAIGALKRYKSLAPEDEAGKADELLARLIQAAANQQ